jgi:hypothetical protein
MMYLSKSLHMQVIMETEILKPGMETESTFASDGFACNQDVKEVIENV